MAKDKEPTDDLHTVTPARMADMAAESASGQLDYVDMPDMEDMTADEPLELVDAPVRAREPMSRADKRRNQPRR